MALEDEYDLAAVFVSMDAYRCAGDESGPCQDPVCAVEVHACFKMFFTAFEVLEMRELYFVFLYDHNAPIFIKYSQSPSNQTEVRINNPIFV